MRVTSTTGGGVAGVVVTFAVASGGGSVTSATPTTGSDGVATVGSWTLGVNAGPNTMTATIPGAGVSGNPATFTATGQLAAFNPNTNTTLSGTRNFSTINIPAGITVTMTGNLTLNATGAVTIAGNIAGDCVALAINAEGALTVSGTLTNGCTGAIPPAGAPAMTLVGKGGWTLNGPGGWVAAGDVTVTDDPTATDADFAPSPAAAPARAAGPRAPAVTPCVTTGGFTGTATPANAPHGADGIPNGTNGKDGSTWVLRCKGGPDLMIGSVNLTGQDGGNGGNGTHSHATAAVSKGGNGGKGGTVKVQAFGSITIGGGTIRTGKGGPGGNSTATGTGAGGNVGASADATGGNGGAPGLFGAFAKTGTINFAGPVTLQIGTAGGTAGGRGGNAIATGHDGHDAEPCPPAVGGPASAAGGLGGSTPDKQLQASVGVTGAANVTVTGGVPGKGGDATATAGKGGKGAKPCKPGANGGDMDARGGKGGDADLRNQLGTKVANGGDGGTMEDINGKGGQGWIDCQLPVYEEGGRGGMGGNAAGSNGAAGTGLASGSVGSAKLTTVSNGGNGGDGLPPGAGGPEGGIANLDITVIAQVTQPSFVPGNPGAPCPGFTMLATPPTQTVQQGGQGSVQVVITRRGGFTGAVTVMVKAPGGAVIGSGTIASGSTSTTVPFTNNLAPGTHTITVEGSASGVPTEIVSLSLVSVAPGGTTDLVIHNFEQAARPWTLFTSKVGTGARTSRSISAGGTVVVPLPTTQTPVELIAQQVVGNDRRTFVFRAGSQDFIAAGGGPIGNKARGAVAVLVTGLPDNTQGRAFVGSATANFPPTSSGSIMVSMSRAQTGIDAVTGCTAYNSSLDPQSTLLSIVNHDINSGFQCNFAGGGVKGYLASSVMVSGVSSGTALGLSGGFQLGDLQTTTYAKTFVAPTATKYVLPGADLPPNVLQFSSVARTTSSMLEQVSYYFMSPAPWLAALPPVFNNPTVNITSIFNTYYEFDVALATQAAYMGAWLVSYVQPNTFGGTNEVLLVTLPNYFGGSVPGTAHFMTPTDNLLNPAYMPKPPGGVTGSVYGYGYNPLRAPQGGETRNFGGRMNVIF